MSLAVVVFFVLGMAAINRARQVPAVWMTADQPQPRGAQGASSYESSSTRAVLVVFVLASAVTLLAGVGLEQSGNELADALGINGVIFGATILAAVTALPEISSGIQAVRLGAVGLAMSDIYGGNAMQLTFFLLADLLAGTPVLPTASAQSLWLGALGAIVTACYIFGLLAPARRRCSGSARTRWWCCSPTSGCPATHLRAWMMLAPAAQVLPKFCPSSAQGCPREIDEEDSHWIPIECVRSGGWPRPRVLPPKPR
jgi:hypothetical protein